MLQTARNVGTEWLGKVAPGLVPVRSPAERLPEPGSCEVRLARSAAEIRLAQRLRYRVFFRDGSAVPSGFARWLRRDADHYDPVCDHLLVLDHAVAAGPFRPARPRIVGTYRLLRREVAEARGGFYSAGEFDLGPLLDAHPDLPILELGRSCVLPSHRSRKVIDLLWQGVWDYARRHEVEALIGCASLPGADPATHRTALSFLHHQARSPEGWRVHPRPELRAQLDLLPSAEIDVRRTFKSLPPLLKGYLRVGATVGEGAAPDPAFGTTDVFVLLAVRAIAERYLDRFGPALNVVPA